MTSFPSIKKSMLSNKMMLFVVTNVTVMSSRAILSDEDCDWRVARLLPMSVHRPIVAL